MGQKHDSRTVVTLVNRNIVITVQEAEKEWGCMLWGLPIYNLKDKKTYIPRISMEGVQFTNCGQYGTIRGAIYLEQNIGTQVFSKISIYKSTSTGITTSSPITLTDSVIYLTVKHGVTV
jgi:hypothetical protein